MNRREAIIAGMAGITAAVAVAPTADAQASQAANPELEQIRALLRAHDEAFTNQDLNGIMACLTEKAVIMGTGPGEIWSGPDEIKVAYEHFFEGFDKGEQKFEYQFRIGRLTSEMGNQERRQDYGNNARKTCRTMAIPRGRTGRTMLIRRRRSGTVHRSEPEHAAADD
jgi:hypothetical protein